MKRTRNPIKTQSFPEDTLKRAASKRTVLYGFHRTRDGNAKPSVVTHILRAPRAPGSMQGQSPNVQADIMSQLSRAFRQYQ